MAVWVNSLTLDNGLNQVKNNAIRMLLISAYVAGDSYATVVGNKLAEATMASADFTLGTSGSNRTLTTATKTAAATASSATPNLHVAFTNNVDTVYWVTNETSDQAITSGNNVNFPAFVLTANQPT